MTSVNLKNLTHKEFVNHLSSVESEQEAFRILPEAARRMEHLIDSLEKIHQMIDNINCEDEQ